jgi:hypothetical protein
MTSPQEQPMPGSFSGPTQALRPRSTNDRGRSILTDVSAVYGLETVICVPLLSPSGSWLSAKA